MNDTFKIVHTSILAFCNQFAEQSQTNNMSDTLTITDFDAHADIQRLPTDEDLIGPLEFSMVMDEKLIEVTTNIAISTVEDTNITRLRALTNSLFQKLTPGQRIPLVDPTNRAPIGTLVTMNGTAILPISRTSTRPLQLISVQMGADLAGP
ncbi:hypothetical protein [Kiloniella sp.]|uniref:hypothetical protein n=1 Tax=Kiloniella sp. TaxID=1938587 RepID=UPI003B014F6D